MVRPIQWFAAAKALDAHVSWTLDDVSVVGPSDASAARMVDALYGPAFSSEDVRALGVAALMAAFVVGSALLTWLTLRAVRDDVEYRDRESRVV